MRCPDVPASGRPLAAIQEWQILILGVSFWLFRGLGVTLGVSVQYDFAGEKRDALETWANRLSAIISGNAAKLIPLARA